MTSTEKYITAIKNKSKKAYAVAALAYITSEQYIENPPDARDFGFTFSGAQSVRNHLLELLRRDRVAASRLSSN